MSATPKYRYLLCYTSAEYAYSTTEVVRDEPISSMADLRGLNEQLSENFDLTQVLIVSFSRFDDPASTREAS